MNTVHLVGDIGDKSGHVWSMNVANYSELIRLIDCQTEGFKQYLINAEENGIGFVFQRADEYINDEIMDLLDDNNMFDQINNIDSWNNWNYEIFNENNKSI